MSNVSTNRTDYVRFFIESNIFGRVKIEMEPGGWEDDKPLLTRSLNHGVFNNFSNTLSFYKKYRDIIEDTFEIEGNNSNLYLIKEELKDNGQDIVWTELYRAKADWETKVIKDDVLEITFNSNDLEDLFEANESDELELENNISLNNKVLPSLQKQKTSLKGRELLSTSKSVLFENDYNVWYQTHFAFESRNRFYSRTKVIASGYERHVSVDTNGDPAGSPLGEGDINASHMFFVNSQDEENVSLELNLKINLEVDVVNEAPSDFPGFLVCELLKFRKEDIGFSIQETILIFEKEVPAGTTYANPVTHIEDFEHQLSLNWNEGLGIRNTVIRRIPAGTVILSGPKIRFRKHDIKLYVLSYQEPSFDLSCIFVHDAFSRLTEIITDDKNLFYSKYFGRTELGYIKDGPGGLIGLIHGYWIRAFNEDSEKYKSPKFSWKKLIESTNCQFNVGVGSQYINGKKKIRVEDIKFFYQNEVVVELGQVSSVERKYDKELYFSGYEFGQSKGGSYENEAGLDEPNIRTTFVSPDRKSKNKYQKISSIRSDETEIEILRRKPELNFPEEDTSADSDNFFLDLKRAYNNRFEQKEWFDRLDEIPTGVNSPETYRSFYFTPLEMLFRHGWIIRSGLEPYLNKTIKYASSESNINLRTKYTNRDYSYRENLPNGLPINRVEKSKMLPSEINFKVKLSEETYNKIYGTTLVFYEGSYEYIPNYYFKMSWINEKQELEYGYLMEMNPKDLAEFKMQKSNEKTITN